LFSGIIDTRAPEAMLGLHCCVSLVRCKGCNHGLFDFAVDLFSE